MKSAQGVGGVLDATVDARQSREDLAMWLRAGRTQRKLSLEDVAKITKIQPRILDKLERGEVEGLPAEVFVKGFVRSFAKCVGLDESEAIRRYTACATGTIPPTAKALVESMGLARTKAMGTPAQPTKVVPAPVDLPIEASDESRPEAPSDLRVDAPVEAALVASSESVPVEAAPIASSGIAPLEAAPIASSEIAPVEAAPVASSEIAPVEAAPIASSEIAQVDVSAAEPVDAAKKKKSRKKNRGARRSKKQTTAPVVETAAVADAAPLADAAPVVEPVVEAPVEAANDAVPVDEDARTTQITKVALETGPIAKTDGESLDTTAIEAKTEERSHDTSAALAIDRAADLADGAVSEPHLATGSDRISASMTSVDIADGEPEVASSGTWQPTMPPIATTPSVPWRRPHITASRTYVVPSLVIDDADPDSADREREHRTDSGKEHRLSFLPPILLDREDRSARQGGLTLAVIILLIAATLTLSYLMRRPSASGDGVTMIDTHAQLLS
jgi:hypothetical protein